MLILNSADVRRALPMAQTVEAMKAAYAALSAGDAIVPLRTRLSIPPQDATVLSMPAYVPGEPEDSLAVKVVTLFPHNLPAGLPFIHAAVLVMDAASGRMLALIEGSTLTAIRTGAGAGAATDLLARPGSRVLAVFGTGAQARTQLEAVCAVRPIEEVRVYSPTPAHVDAFIAALAPLFPVRFRAAASPSAALDGADIVCAATTASRPVFLDVDVPAGLHINGVGSYSAEMVEIPPETVARSLAVVDSRSACLAEAGEVIHAVNAGLLAADALTEIGDIILGRAAGRPDESQLTYFKSVGVAVQDAAAARLALANARVMGLGTAVDW